MDRYCMQRKGVADQRSAALRMDAGVQPGQPYNRATPRAFQGCGFAPVDGALSSNDVWFTHPFGFDWETLIAPDARYYELLAPSNSGINSSNSEYVNGMNRARQLLLDVPRGIINTETDQDLIPPQYRAHDGDRVAVLGRWIADCGHNDYHSEIHPPLLFVRAQAIPSGANPDASSSGAPSVTFSRIIGRPYLVGQEFHDGALSQHLNNEVTKALATLHVPDVLCGRSALGSAPAGDAKLCFRHSHCSVTSDALRDSRRD